MGDEVDLQKMFKELTGYEKNRVDLRIDGIPASPMQIVQAHVVREEPKSCGLPELRVTDNGECVRNEKAISKGLCFTWIRSN